MTRVFVLWATIVTILFEAGSGIGADMQEYQKRIGNYHRLLEKAERQRAKGDSKEADKTLAKAEQEKALADVALNAPGRLPRINEPTPIIYYERPYYGYWGWNYYWRRPYPWWGYRRGWW